MSINKVKGAIFKAHTDGCYYRSYLEGSTANKAHAYVYTCEEIIKHQAQLDAWAAKEDGKWVIVYEQEEPRNE